MLASIKSNQFYLPFAEQVEHWERTLANVSEVIEMALRLQRHWIYMENIFIGAEDIRSQLPEEAGWFDEVNRGFSMLMGRIAAKQKALDACSVPGLLDGLIEMNAKLECIQKSLDDYLEKKRLNFFFFDLPRQFLFCLDKNFRDSILYLMTTY